MLSDTQLEHVLFLDIETVPASADYDFLSPEFKKLWKRKAGHIAADKSPKDVYQRAGVYAEFGRIICISVGYHLVKQDEEQLRIMSFSGDDEKKLLADFAALIRKKFKGNWFLCAHNGKEFDFPYIARRMLVNSISLPKAFQIAGKKPWEVPHLDTLELWKFGDYKHYTSLELLTTLFHIPTPKSDINGSEVARVYYVEQNLPRIVAYCECDVVAVAQLLRRYINKELLKEFQIKIVRQE